MHMHTYLATLRLFTRAIRAFHCSSVVPSDVSSDPCSCRPPARPRAICVSIVTFHPTLPLPASPGAICCLHRDVSSGPSLSRPPATVRVRLQTQARSGAKRPLPFAIMTSDDTHARTEALLKQHANFGMADGQVTLLKQEKVACLIDNDATLAVEEDDPFK
eukprot:121202-Chlamydomonas_euryale.AAC.3